MTSIRRLLVAALFSVVLAELLASIAVWSGQPTDTTWEPSFWIYELQRMKYWLPLMAVALLCSVAIAYLSSRRPKIAVGAFFLLCLFADYLASLLFRRSLPWAEAGLLGWSYEPRYVSEHLWSWIVSLCVIVALWPVWRKWVKPRLQAHLGRIRGNSC